MGRFRQHHGQGRSDHRQGRSHARHPWNRDGLDTAQGSGQQRLDLDKGDGDEGDEGIEEAFVDPGFEGEFQVVLGTDSQTYRVFTLSDTTRLVFVVADDDQQGQDGQGDQDHHDDDNS